MTLRFRFSGDDIGRKLDQKLQGDYGRMADASRNAMNRAREEIKTRGDADILAAGKFGKRWTDSFNVIVRPPRGRTINLLLDIFHTIPYANIHERGGTIHGKPLLWIPLPWTGIRMRAREYGRRYGLFYVERKDKTKNPLLLSIRDKKPKYVGVEQVTLKKRFHITQITREVASKLPAYYRAAFRALSGRGR